MNLFCSSSVKLLQIRDDGHRIANEEKTNMNEGTDEFGNQNTIVKPKVNAPGLWERISTAYRIKKYSNQTFYATVVALQVVVIGLLVLGVVLLALKESRMNSVGLSLLNGFSK